MTEPLAIRSDAEALAAPLPPLLAEAEHLASTVLLGDHGRRRARWPLVGRVLSEAKPIAAA